MKIKKLVEAIEEDEILSGPELKDNGVADLLLGAIKDKFESIQNYNMIMANLDNYPEIKSVIESILFEENNHVGKLQQALKSISPNAEEIMNGAIEAEEVIEDEKPEDTVNESINDKKLLERRLVEIDKAIEYGAKAKKLKDERDKIVSYLNKDDKIEESLNVGDIYEVDDSNDSDIPGAKFKVIESRSDAYKIKPINDIAVKSWKRDRLNIDDGEWVDKNQFNESIQLGSKVNKYNSSWVVESINRDKCILKEENSNRRIRRSLKSLK